jgi:hypothetical protein
MRNRRTNPYPTQIAMKQNRKTMRKTPFADGRNALLAHSTPENPFGLRLLHDGAGESWFDDEEIRVIYQSKGGE